ncbi:YdeI/OmpD-associated family protein [Algoriphagus namhaensis]
MTETVDCIFVESLKELQVWLRQNHRQKDSVWLGRWKKGFTDGYIRYADLVDELLCWGWVDSLPRKWDEQRTLLRISPRNPQSNWSGVNKRKAEKLIRNGRMQEAGLHLIQQAKENGCWTYLDEVEKLIIPTDLENQLQKYPDAKLYFDRFPDSSKRGILEWIKSAKTAPTREKRILETAEKASRNLKANFPEGRNAGPKPFIPSKK